MDSTARFEGSSYVDERFELLPTSSHKGLLGQRREECIGRYSLYRRGVIAIGAEDAGTGGAGCIDVGAGGIKHLCGNLSWRRKSHDCCLECVSILRKKARYTIRRYLHCSMPYFMVCVTIRACCMHIHPRTLPLKRHSGSY